jgi:hypothetical protein
MLRKARNNWQLSVTPEFGKPPLPSALEKLNGAVLHVLGQHQTDASDTFAIFVGHLTGNGISQIVGGAIDEHDHVGFIFLADGHIRGPQYVFQGQHKDDGTIGGSIALGAKDDDVDPDLGIWSGTGGGADDDDCDDDDED